MILYYIKHYPFSITIILIVAYLSFFHPPSTDVPQFSGMDKVAHFCMYAGLSGIIWLEFLLNHRKKAMDIRYAIIGAIICPIVFGGAIEFLQEYITDHRQGDLLDFIANTSGVLVSAIIARFILRPLIIRK